MSTDTIAIGTAAAAVIVGSLWTLHRDMRAMDTRIGRDFADLRERMTRLEGLFEGFTRRESGASNEKS